MLTVKDFDGPISTGTIYVSDYDGTNVMEIDKYRCAYIGSRQCVIVSDDSVEYGNLAFFELKEEDCDFLVSSNMDPSLRRTKLLFKDRDAIERLNKSYMKREYIYESIKSMKPWHCEDQNKLSEIYNNLF